MIGTAALLAIFAAAFAASSRLGRLRVHPFAAVTAILGAALVTVVSLRAPLVGWRFPSATEAVEAVYGLSLLAGTTGLAAFGRRGETAPRSRRFVAVAVALAASGAFALGVVRSRGRPEISSCVTSTFWDEHVAKVTSGRFRATAPVELGTRADGDKICALAIESSGATLRTEPISDGRTYDGTPICATGQMAICGDILAVADGEPSMYNLEYDRFRAFRLPSFDVVPTAIGGGAVATPRALLVLAALGALVAAVGAAGSARRRLDGGTCAILGAALATPLVTSMLPLVT